jgi:hypothetical protein
MDKYLLKSDPRQPSKANCWGLMPAESPEEASALFKARVMKCSSTNASGHLHRMMEDRDRRLATNDFDVELL